MIMVIAHTEEAGYHVKEFIEKHKRLPDYVSCICYSDKLNKTTQNVNLTMPQFLYVTTALLDLNTYDVEIINVDPPRIPIGVYKPGEINEKEYRIIAQNIKNFIVTNGRAPNYANSSLGKLSYETLIYLYARIWAFMGEKHHPPQHIKVNK